MIDFLSKDIIMLPWQALVSRKPHRVF